MQTGCKHKASEPGRQEAGQLARQQNSQAARQPAIAAQPSHGLQVGLVQRHLRLVIAGREVGLGGPALRDRWQQMGRQYGKGQPQRRRGGL